MSHTPGPWTGFLGESGGEASWLIGPSNARPIVAHVEADEEAGLTGATVEANARLIAAAPDLLEACKGLQAIAHDIANDPELMASRPWAERQAVLELSMAVDAAIAKAEGAVVVG